MEESKDLHSLENMDLSGIFAANRNILKSVCRLLKRSKSTLFQKKTQKKYLQPNRGGDENKTESEECTPVDVNNLDTDSEDTASLQNEWLIHLVLGNLPRDGGLHLMETDTPNTAESECQTSVSKLRCQSKLLLALLRVSLLITSGGTYYPGKSLCSFMLIRTK